MCKEYKKVLVGQIKLNPTFIHDSRLYLSKTTRKMQIQVISARRMVDWNASLPRNLGIQAFTGNKFPRPV